MAEPAAIEAAGAVVWRPEPGGARVALVHRPRYDDWSLPKGKRLPGEHVLVTAVREVAEETGVRVRLGRRLPSASYLSHGTPKRVDYWAARPSDPRSGGPGRTGGPGTGGGAGPDGGPGQAGAPGERAGRGDFPLTQEVDDVAWLPAAAARDRLTYAHDAAVLEEFTAGPADSVALILARHAVAESKEAWRAAGHADDRPRPLTAGGRAQARALAHLLACFAPTRVVSSSAGRCVATVRPYAAARGLDVEAEPAFTVPGGGRAPGGAPARRAIAQVIADGEPAVVCAHRENLPSLLAWACEDLGAAVPAGPPLDKGAFWVLQIGSGRLVSAEQHRVGGSARAPDDQENGVWRAIADARSRPR